LRPRYRHSCATLTQVKAAPWPRGILAQRVHDRSILMMDVAMLAIGFAFFAISIAYVYACDLL